MQVNTIILSKDRPAQAHLCLDSIRKNGNGLFNPVTVIFKASNEDYRKGYKILESYFDYISFVNETSYYNDIIEHVDESYEFTTFMTDDDIIYRKIHNEDEIKINSLFQEMDDVSVFSLRLGRNTYIQDPYNNTHTIFPNNYYGSNNLIVWEWNTVPSYMNFGYPLSVDGHIFRTNEIKSILTSVKFNNPNQQEIAMMSKTNMINKFMGCDEESFIVNTPLNRVQETCMNRAGEDHGQDAETMNLRYLSNEKLDLDSIDFSNIIGCHQELDIKWTTR